MLGRLKQMAENAKALDQNKILQDIFSDPTLQKQMEGLQTGANGGGQMYDEGVDSKGVSLGQYAPITISHYKPLAASEGRDGRTDHITLKDTGTFYASIKVEALPDAFKITADDPNNLIGRYPDLLGLDDSSLNEIMPEVNERFQEETVKALLA